MTHAEPLNSGMTISQTGIPLFWKQKLLTKSYIHSVLARCHFDTAQLSHTYVATFKFFSHVGDDDTSLEVALVPHARGQRSSIASLQSQESDVRVGHGTGDGAVFTCTHQDDVHHGTLEGILRV